MTSLDAVPSAESCVSVVFTQDRLIPVRRLTHRDLRPQTVMHRKRENAGGHERPKRKRQTEREREMDQPISSEMPEPNLAAKPGALHYSDTMTH